MILSHALSPALSRFVRYYYQVEEVLQTSVVLQPVPARSPEIIEFMFATPYVVERRIDGTMGECWPATLVGPKTHRHVNLHLSGRVNAFTIAFQPGGLAALFGVPSYELTDLDFEAPAVLGRAIHALRERLGEASAIVDRARIVDEFLLERSGALRPASPIVKAARVVHLCRGSLRVDEMAERMGLGMRQFERRFRHEIGMPPKLYARIVRFEAALRMKSALPTSRWTDVAHMLSYHDQMHMIHDFNQLSGDTPAGIVDRLDMFVKPEVDNLRRGGGPGPHSASEIHVAPDAMPESAPRVKS